MLSARLLHLVETHSHELAKGVAQLLRRHPRTPSYRLFSESEIEQRSEAVFHNLGAWTTRSEDRIRAAFEAMGRERYLEAIPLPEVIYALLLHKTHLLNFVEFQGQMTALEIYGEQQLRVALDHFYDLAIYFSSLGYWQAQERAVRQAA